MTEKDKKIRKKLKDKIKSDYLIVALYSWKYNNSNLSYTQFYNLIKNKDLFLVKNQNNYQNYFNYCTFFIVYLKNDEVKLYKFDNSDYKLVEFVLNKFNKYEDRIIEKKLENVVGVRWLGAFNTNTTTKKHSFAECLEWEYSAKDREVACDIFSENFGFVYQYKNRVYNSYDNLYKRCKLAFVYSSDDIRVAYDCDIYSRQLGKMLVGSNENYHIFNLADNAEDFANENNIITVYISSKLDKYIFDNVNEDII